MADCWGVWTPLAAQPAVALVVWSRWLVPIPDRSTTAIVPRPSATGRLMLFRPWCPSSGSVLPVSESPDPTFGKGPESQCSRRMRLCQGLCAYFCVAVRSIRMSIAADGVTRPLA